jgi:hypothetical protein
MDIARTLSFDQQGGFHGHNYHPEQVYNGQAVNDHHNKSPYAPPSPLFTASSDTESSTSAGLAQGALGTSGPAASAPKTMEYFRITRDHPDEAWRQVESERQRRSSVAAPAVRPLFTPISRQYSVHSVHSHTSVASTDSLNSLWHHEDAQLGIARSTSGPGMMRGMTAMRPVGQRSSSSSSDGSTHPGARLAVRSNLSQTSLASPPTRSIPIPPEFGSAPAHTVSLFLSYASAFPDRTGSRTSGSYTQKGLHSANSASSSDIRRGSYTGGAGLTRPASGTIRAKSKRDINTPAGPTWDSFGMEAVLERAEKARLQRESLGQAGATGGTAGHMDVPRGRTGASPNHDSTPKQSLVEENGRWKIKYTLPTPVTAVRSESRSSAASSRSTEDGNGGILIPSRARHLAPGALAFSTSHSTATGRTPQEPHAMGVSMDRAATVGADASGVAGSMPKSNLGPRRPSASSEGHAPVGSVPRRSSTWNWDELEKKGGKLYELPKGMGNKSGLFYFQ